MNPNISRTRNRGFALVVSLTMLVLLTIIAVGMLGLSSISLRTAGQQTAMAEARANARLSLMMAIGQLQETAGDDRRISRTADQIPQGSDGDETAAAPGRRHWTGIYRGWDPNSEERPDPELLAWLVSGDAQPTGSGGSSGMVELVGEGTVGNDADGFVVAPMVEVRRDNRVAGHLAWWTGDQNMKAMIASPAADDPVNEADVRARLQAASRAEVSKARAGATRPFQNLDPNDPKLAALTSWRQSGLIADAPQNIHGLFHDLAVHNSGMLVNVRRGGFQRDLSMEFELEDEPDPVSSALYTITDSQSQLDPGINMQELRSYYQLTDSLTPVSGNYTTGGAIPRGTLGLVLGNRPSDNMNDEHFHFKMPALISLQAVFSLTSRPVQVDGDEMQRLYLAVDPVLTFWNPLDVPVVIPQTAWMTYNMFQFPYTLDIRAGRQQWECPLISTLSGATVDINRDFNFAGIRVGDVQQIILKPGEVIKVSQRQEMRIEGNNPNRAVQASAGFNYGGGIARPMRDKNGQDIVLSPNANITYQMRPNELTAGQTSQSGNSLHGGNQHTRHFALHYHEFFIGTDRPNQGGVGYGRMTIDYDFGDTRPRPGAPWVPATRGTKPPSDRLYADDPSLAQIFPTFTYQDTRPLSMQQLSREKVPVLMYTYSAKTERDSPTGTRSLLRFNPRAHAHDLYDLGQYERDLAAFDFQVEALDSWVNRRLETSPQGNAFFGGSHDAQDGVSRLIFYSVPQEPIHSLGALQHAMANGFNTQRPLPGYTGLNARQPMLPQISHAIGNSFAPAVLSPNETSRQITGGRPVADHSYLANTGLWDDWFFSSIAPRMTRTAATRMPQRTVAMQFLDGSARLPLSRYLPDLGGREPSEVLAELLGRTGPLPDAPRRMAAYMRVEGMFNVNSTSVEAWKAMLSGLFGEETVTMNDGGQLSRSGPTDGVPVAGLLASTDHVAPGNGAVAPSEPTQWTGRRVLSEDEITELAEAIVREVRLRGPFLSLADFVNRRVGSDRELARAGAIQNALDSTQVSINEAYNGSQRSVPAAVAQRLPFPEAEQGPIAAGIPGIVKQADILTPLAPYLSARSDSFLIRGYGEVLDGSGNVIARAWCEAVVERRADFVDPADARTTPWDELSSQANRDFGRRFEIVSFRWLNPQEV